MRTGVGARVQLGAATYGTVALTDICDELCDNVLDGLRAGAFVRCAVLADAAQVALTGIFAQHCNDLHSYFSARQDNGVCK